MQILNDEKDDAKRQYYTDVLRGGHNIVVFDYDGQYLFGPSRFVGYKNNDERHQDRESDGGETNKAIEKILGGFVDRALSQELDEKFKEYVRSRGKDEPHKILRKYWLKRLDIEECIDDFNNQVEKAKKTNCEERRKYLEKANVKPEKNVVSLQVFKRNPYVVAEVLERAGGVCEKCKQEAPFYRASDGSPYLEVHHKIMLAAGGEDTVGNAIAVCPNCHRMLHYGIES